MKSSGGRTSSTARSSAAFSLAMSGSRRRACHAWLGRTYPADFTSPPNEVRRPASAMITPRRTSGVPPEITASSLASAWNSWRPATCAPPPSSSERSRTATTASAPQSSRDNWCCRPIPSTSKDGNPRSSAGGRPQARSPRSWSTAGTIVMRTMNASTATPTVRARAMGLIVASSSGTNAMKTPTMMSAATATTGAELANPVRIASRASPRRCRASAMRETRNTS